MSEQNKAEIEQNARHLAKHTVIYGFGNVLSTLIAFLLLPVYTSYLTPNEYGIKELVGLSTDVINILLATTISSAIQRFYFQYEKEKDRNEVISSAFLMLGGMGLVAVGLLSLTTRTLATYIIDDPQLYYFFLISFTSLWFQSQVDVGLNYLRANYRSTLYIIISLSKLVLALSLNIYFIIFLETGVVGILLSTLITSVVIYLLFVLPLYCKLGFRFSWDKIRQMLRYGLPLVPAQLGAFIVHLSDRFFLKGICSISDAGIYSLGYRFGTLPDSFISRPFNQVWLPRRFEVYKQENAEYLFGRIFSYFLCLMIFAALCVSVLTRELLMIIADEKFWGAAGITPIIAISSVIFCLHYHFNIGILIVKKTKYIAYINTANGVLVLLLNYFLIRRFGIYGAATTTLIAFVFKVSLTYIISRKYYKIYFEWLRIGKLLITAVALFLLAQMVVLPMPALGFLLKLGIVLLYPIVLLLLGFFTAAERGLAAAFLASKLGLRKQMPPGED